jgi:hypothetical protein
MLLVVLLAVLLAMLLVMLAQEWEKLFSVHQLAMLWKRSEKLLVMAMRLAMRLAMLLLAMLLVMLTVGQMRAHNLKKLSVLKLYAYMPGY